MADNFLEFKFFEACVLQRDSQAVRYISLAGLVSHMNGILHTHRSTFTYCSLMQFRGNALTYQAKTEHLCENENKQSSTINKPCLFVIYCHLSFLTRFLCSLRDSSRRHRMLWWIFVLATKAYMVVNRNCPHFCLAFYLEAMYAGPVMLLSYVILHGVACSCLCYQCFSVYSIPYVSSTKWSFGFLILKDGILQFKTNHLHACWAIFFLEWGWG